MIYITIFDDGKKLRLRALPNQKDYDGRDYDTSFNIQGDKDIRRQYKPGTVLVTDYLTNTGRGFYRAGYVRHATKREAIGYNGKKVKVEKCIEQELNLFEVF